MTKCNVRFDTVLVTPQKAEQWLQRNSKNRKLSEAMVRGLSDDMIAGLWRVTTDCVGFDVNGILTNGQHRLSAIVKSGVSCWMGVATELEDASRGFTDGGRPRTAGDGLKINNVAHFNEVARVARSLRLLERTAPGRTAGRFTATHAEIVAHRYGMDRVQRVIVSMTNAPKGVGVAAALAVGVLVDAALGASAGGVYADSLVHGAGPAQLIALRERLLRSPSKSGGDQFIYETGERIAAAVKHWQDGTTILSIKPSAAALANLVEMALASASSEARQLQ